MRNTTHILKIFWIQKVILKSSNDKYKKYMHTVKVINICNKQRAHVNWHKGTIKLPCQKRK
jgi:hypothetical protein